MAMKYRFFILGLLLFLGSGCWNSKDWYLDFNHEPETATIEGKIISHNTREGIPYIYLYHEVIGDFGHLLSRKYLDASDPSGTFFAYVTLHYWEADYLIVEVVDSLYQPDGYVNGVYTSNIGKIALKFPENPEFVNRFKIELIEK